MTGETRFTWGLILDVLDVFERHGYQPRDKVPSGQAVIAVRELARRYEDAGEARYRRSADQVLPQALQSGGDAVVLSGDDIGAVAAALDVAADYKRDRAETCGDCADRSCPACNSRLCDAQAYDRLAAQILRTAQPADPGRAEPHRPGISPDQAGRDVGREAGQ